VPVTRRRTSTSFIGWTTVRYRSVMMAIAGATCLLVVVYYIVFPAQAHTTLAALQGMAEAALEKISAHTGDSSATSRGEQQANFTALEGSVRVRKRDGNSWTAANFNLPLEKGDVVQTGADGIAKIVFADGTNYVVKQDSLIVVEESSINTQQQTKVAVQVTTGTVDLSTGTFSDGSSSSVIVAGARARFSPDTAAQVHNDPRQDQHEIVVRKGSGEVTRGRETVKVNELDRVSFSQTAQVMTRTRELGPPVLISPANMMPVFTAGSKKPVQFTWTPVEGAKEYRLRVSRSPYFATTLLDRNLETTQADAPPLSEGAYYWAVQSVAESGRQSPESEKNRFTVIAHKLADVAMGLELEPFIQHGRMIEVRGHTDVDARVMVNGTEVPIISNDGSFRYFTRPLPVGENVITVTAQNLKGGVNTKQEKVLIQ
jgi:quercetin dioxygenase-like cupin family protein